MIRPRSLLALCWLVAVTANVGADQPDKNSLKAYVQRTAGKQAYGVYIQSHKVGWMITETKLDKLDGQEVCVSSEQAYFEMNRAGETLTIDVKSSTRFGLTGEGAVIDTEEQSKEQGRTVTRKGVRKGDKFVVSVTNKAGKTERTLEPPKKTLALARKIDTWLQGGPNKGATMESFTLSLEEDDIDTKEVYTFLEKKTVAWGGVPTDVFHVNVLSRGAKSDMDIRSDGTPIRGKIGGLLEIRAEPEATAKKLDAKGIDLMALSSIEADKNIGDPNKVDELVIEVQNLGDYKMPQSHRQKLATEKNGKVTLTLKRDFRVEKDEPLPKAELAKMLKATSSVQSDDKKIRDKAKQIVGDEKDLIEKAKLIQKWVYKNMRQTMNANANTSLEVLDQMAGDCTEHALIFTALARAADIPAREVGGVAFVPLGKPLFGWHAWSEIHDGKQWITVDPTWNQFMVDATHIKFSEEADDWAWLNVLGKVKFKIVDYKKK